MFRQLEKLLRKCSLFVHESVEFLFPYTDRDRSIRREGGKKNVEPKVQQLDKKLMILCFFC